MHNKTNQQKERKMSEEKNHDMVSLETTLDLSNYVKAGYSLLMLETFEIKRAMASIVVSGTNNGQPITKLVWNVLEGLVDMRSDLQDPTEFLQYVDNLPENTVVLLENFDHFFGSEFGFVLAQRILNIHPKLKFKHILLVFVGVDSKQIPPQLEKLIPVIEFALPKKEEFQVIAKDLCEQVDLPYDEITANLCSGMSLEEGENALAYSIVTKHSLDKDIILNMKRSTLRKTGFMDYAEPVPLNMIGGLENAKEYMFKRLDAWNNPLLPKLNSVFLVGVTGCGKTLFAKVMADVFGFPLIFWDINACKDSLVGNTEKNMRLATKIIDASGNAIVVIDEVEKILAGSSGNIQDTSGVSQGILAHFLTWMQETEGKSDRIIVVTANGLDGIPPEFIGRFDTSFYVGFPNASERTEIINIMNSRYGSELPTNADFVERLDRWTGREIERLSRESLFYDIDEAFNYIPLVRDTKKREIERMEEYAKQMRHASKQDVKKTYGRRIGEKKKMVEETPLVTSSMRERLSKIIKDTKKGE